jgi:hypothetical protein
MIGRGRRHVADRCRAVAAESVCLQIASHGLPCGRAFEQTRRLDLCQEAPPEGRRLGNGRRLGDPPRENRCRPRADPAKLGERAIPRDQVRGLDRPAKRRTARATKRLPLALGSSGLLGRQTEQLAQVGVGERLSR